MTYAQPPAPQPQQPSARDFRTALAVLEFTREFAATFERSPSYGGDRRSDTEKAIEMTEQHMRRMIPYLRPAEPRPAGQGHRNRKGGRR